MNEPTDRPYPPTAQLAMQGADVAADNLKALLKNQPLEKFVFDDKGTVASLGKKDAMGTVFNENIIYGKTATFMKKARSEEHTSELQSRGHLVCRLLLEKKKIKY